jgi:hypothetical protein
MYYARINEADSCLDQRANEIVQGKAVTVNETWNANNAMILIEESMSTQL